MTDKNLNLSLYLRELRITKDLKLREVEKLTNNEVSNAYISQLESGKIVNPSPHILQHLASAYNVSYESLMIAAGYLHPSENAKSGTAFFNESDITTEEKEQLLDYLQFIRKQRDRKTQ